MKNSGYCFQVRETTDSNLDFILHQLYLLKAKLTEEQRRLSNIIQRKDKKIKSQKHLIRKMKNQIEMQSLQISEEFFKISTVNNMSLPTILVEDATEMTEKPVTNSEGIREPRSHSTTLRRQSKLTRGAERPNLFILRGRGDKRNNQPGVAWQHLSQILHKNISQQYTRNLSTEGKETVKATQDVGRKEKQNESDVDSGVWSGRSCNDDVEDRRRRKSYQSWSRPGHNNIIENNWHEQRHWGYF